MQIIKPAGQGKKPLPSIRADPPPAPKSHSGSAGATEEAEHPKTSGHQTHSPFPPSREDTVKAQGRLQRWGPEQEAERNGKEREVCSSENCRSLPFLLVSAFPILMERLPQLLRCPISGLWEVLPALGCPS